MIILSKELSRGSRDIRFGSLWYRAKAISPIFLVKLERRQLKIKMPIVYYRRVL